MHLIIQTEKLEDKLREYFKLDSSGHDIFHLKRVMNLALHIQEKEGGNRTIVGISALLHDVHRIMQNETSQYCSPLDSLERVKIIIENSDIKLSEKQIKMILHCIQYHEEYNFACEGKTVNDIDTLLLQDADNLDAIGAIGVGRTFAYSGANGVIMWNPEIPFDRDVYNESIKDPSTVHHFYSKLLKLKNNMNTDTAKEMANKRHKFMEDFLDEFLAEWRGER